MIRHCKCGEMIWVESVWNGLEYISVYYDCPDEIGKESREISHCPGCGQFLTPADFREKEDGEECLL